MAAHVVDLGAHRDARLSASASMAARSQRIYERITAMAAATRRNDFTLALESGVATAELAAAVGLEVKDVRAIVAGRST